MIHMRACPDPLVWLQSNCGMPSSQRHWLCLWKNQITADSTSRTEAELKKVIKFFFWKMGIMRMLSLVILNLHYLNLTTVNVWYMWSSHGLDLSVRYLLTKFLYQSCNVFTLTEPSLPPDLPSSNNWISCWLVQVEEIHIPFKVI